MPAWRALPALLALSAPLRRALSLRVLAGAPSEGVEIIVPPVKDLAPIWWLDIPNSGSAFATTLAHHVCAHAIDALTKVRDPHNESLRFEPVQGYGRCSEAWGTEGCSTNRWNSRCGASSFLRFDRDHRPLPADFPEDKLRHVAAMFREPRQRAISGWSRGGPGCEGASDLRAYAECVQNCSARMLTGAACDGRPPGGAKLEEAPGRVRRLGFVGLTGRWELSVCLFHAMHGGICKAEEFASVLPAGKARGDADNATTALLDGYTPGVDDEVYTAAESVFWQNVEKYNVSRRNCREVYCQDFSEPFALRGVIVRGSKMMSKFDFDWPRHAGFDED